MSPNQPVDSHAEPSAPPRAVVLIADGSEEMEAVIVVDVLRRAGLDVVLAGLDGAEPVRCSRGVVLVPDQAMADVDGPFDALVLIGGKGGVERYEQSPYFAELIEQAVHMDQWIAAICAAPRALVNSGYFGGKCMTSHPSVRAAVSEHVVYSEARVVVNGKLITSQGPGTAVEMALAIVTRLCGEAKATEIAGPMMLAE